MDYPLCFLTKTYILLWYVFSAYFATVGTIYSPKLTLIGVLFGPLPI